MGTLSERIAEWVINFDVADAPQTVVQNAKKSLLDTVGCGLAGYQTEAANRAREYVEAQYGDGPCTLLGSERKLASCGAAFANCVSAHSLDFDDTCYAGSPIASSTHGSAVVLPAVLASAETVRASGKAFLTAFIAGSEAEYLVCRVVTPSLYGKGWFTTSALGVIGAAVGAAKVSGLNFEQTVAAIGLAVSRAANTRVCLGTDSNAYSSARASEGGITAAILAQLGADGPPDVFEAPNGFFQVYNGGTVNLERADDLGREWGFGEPGLWYKMYPVCTAAQAVAEAVLTLANKYDIDPAAVAKVRCEVSPLVAKLLRYAIPQTTAEAQFSLPFAVGCMLVYRRLTVAELSEQTRGDQRLQDVMAKTRMVPAKGISNDARMAKDTAESATAAITLADGSEVSATNDVATGTPWKPMSRDQLHHKYMTCAESGGLSRTAAERLASQLEQIEALPEISHLSWR